MHVGDIFVNKNGYICVIVDDMHFPTHVTMLILESEDEDNIKLLYRWNAGSVHDLYPRLLDDWQKM